MTSQNLCRLVLDQWPELAAAALTAAKLAMREVATKLAPADRKQLDAVADYCESVLDQRDAWNKDAISLIRGGRCRNPVIATGGTDAVGRRATFLVHTLSVPTHVSRNTVSLTESEKNSSMGISKHLIL